MQNKHLLKRPANDHYCYLQEWSTEECRCSVLFDKTNLVSSAEQKPSTIDR